MTLRTLPALYMRGGASKGVFLRAADLPAEARARDTLLLRLFGSPDPSGRQVDGMGGASAATSKVMLVGPSTRPDCDIDYRFGQVSIAEARIDWSGNCDDLTAAVGPYALWQGWVATRAPHTTVRLWQENLGQRILAHVPCPDGAVLEEGPFQEHGVPFPGAEIGLEYLDPAMAGKRLLPTGRACDVLELPDFGKLRVSLIDAGDPTVCVRADALGLTGRELPEALNRKHRLLARLEAIRAHGAVAMRLARSVEEAMRNRPGTPGLAIVAAPANYRSSTGDDIAREAIDVLARLVTRGQLQPAFSSAGSIALAVAAALPGSVVAEVARTLPGVPTRIGQVTGVLAVGAFLSQNKAGWRVDKVVLSRGARRLMEGLVYVPHAPASR